MFDFSKYPDNSRIYDVKDKKVIGKMKDETKCVPIGLKCKMCSCIEKDVRWGRRKGKRNLKKHY